ncbi:MAG: hypothetical protein ACFNLO_06210 [Selenomonas massiliensis]
MWKIEDEKRVKNVLSMKNYRKIFRIQDKRAIEALYTNVEVMQAAGQYPEEFNMPIILQYGLVSECNLYCKHCYNGSGENHTTRMAAERWKELSCHVVGHGGNPIRWRASSSWE